MTFINHCGEANSLKCCVTQNQEDIMSFILHFQYMIASRK